MSFYQVLFIENNASDQLAAQQQLDQSQFPYECEYAPSLAGAREDIMVRSFDCVVLPVEMVDDTISEFLAELNKRGIPLVALARVGQEGTIIRLMQQGAADYLIQDPDRHYLQLLPVTLQKAIAAAQTKQRLTTITEQQQIEQQFLRAVIDAVPNRIFVKDGNGQYLLVNQEMADFYGTTVEELLHKRDTDCRVDATTVSHFAQENRHVIETQQELFIPEERDVNHRGEERWLQWHKLPIQLPGHAEMVVLGVGTDITQHKQAEQFLHESEERFRATFEKAAIGICHFSPDGQLLRFNPRFCEISGYTAAELKCLTFQEITYPDDLPDDLQRLQGILRGTLSTYTAEKRYIRKDRRVIWINLTVSLVRDEAGHPSYLIGIVEDITVRKQAEANLRKSERRYASLAAAAPVGIFRTDEWGNCIYVNDRWCEIAGIPLDKALQQGWVEAIHPADRKAVFAAWEQAARSQQPFRLEYRFQRSDSAVFWVFGQAVAEYTPEGKITGFVGTITDITARRQAEAALHQLNQELEQRVDERTAALQQLNRQLQAAIAERQTLAALVENSTDFIITATPTGQITYLNQAGRLLIGLDATTEISQYVIPDFHFPEDWPELQETVLYPLEQGKSWQGEIRLRHFQTGVAIPMMHSAFPIKHPETGEILAIAGILRDITERKQIEQQLRDLSDRLTLAVISGGIGIWEWDICRNEVIWDDRMYELYGLRRGEFTNVYEAWLHAIHPDDRAPAELISQQACRGERDYNPDFRVIHADGSVHYIQAYALIQRDPSGEPLRMVGINFDITARKQAEVALRESERRYATLTEAAPVAIFRFNIAGECIYVNDRWSEITGRPTVAGLGWGWLETIHPDDREWICTAVTQWTATCQVGDLYRQEARTLRPDGSVIWYDCQMLPETDASGTIIGYVGTLADISDRKFAAAALQASEERYRQIVETQTEFVMRSLPDTTITFANASFCQTMGAAPDHVTGMTWEKFVPPEDLAILRQKILALSPAEPTFENTNSDYRPNGQIGWTLWINLGIFNEQGELLEIQSVGRDITQLHETEKQLRAVSERLNLALESAQIGTWEWDIATNQLLWDDRMCALYGFSREDFNGHYQDWKQRIHPDDWDNLYQAEQQALRGERNCNIEFRLILPNGSIRYISSSALVQRDQRGNPVRSIGLNIDISDRKLAEVALRNSEARFRSYFELSLIGMAITSPAKGWVEVNDHLCEIFGYSRTELTQLTWTEITYPADLGVDLAHFNQVMAGETDGYTLDKRFIRKDGTIIYTSISVRCLRRNDGVVDYFVALVQDITARKQAEDRLRESEASLLEAQRVAHIGNWSFDLSNQAINWSEELYQMFGLDPSQPPPRYEEYLTKIHPADRPTLIQCVETAIAAGIPYTIDYQTILPDGSIRYHEGRGEAVRNQQGQVVKLVGTALDITERKQVELELQRNRDLREAIFERSTDALFIIDPATDLIMDCNQRAVEMFEANDKSELLNICGNTLQRYPFSPTVLKSIIAEVSTKGFWQQELEYTTRKGKYFWASIAGTKIAMADQDVRLVRLSDITARIQVEQLLHQQLNKEQLLVAVLMRIRDSLEINAILDATVQEVRQVLSVDRILVYHFNDDYSGKVVAEACSVFWKPMLNLEFSAAPFPEDSFQRYIEGGYYMVADCHQATMAECAQQFMLKFQIRAKLVVPIVQQENKKLWGLLVAHQCGKSREWDFWEMGLLQQLAGQLAIAIQQADLYQQVQAELAERQRAEAILQTTNEQLHIANRELARATQLKDEFLANMSHELRTPLNAILGMSETLQEKVFGPLSEQQHKAVSTIERSGRHLLDLINEILDLAKIEAGKLELTLAPYSVQALCTSSTTLIKQIAYQKNIRLSAVVPPDLGDIEIDERRMRQVLVNLLSNAIKFTPTGGSVTLEVWSQSTPTPTQAPDPLPYPVIPSAHFMYFSVLDTGIGIAPADIAKLFQAFVQIDSKLNRQYNGTGLGLALVKRITELHRGWVQVESQLGQGSRFTVVIPYQPASQTVGGPTTQSTLEAPLLNQSGQLVTDETANRPPLILLAEDNSANIETYSNYLMNCGYRLVVATNGAAAVTLAQQHRPDIILMDIQMPDMDGLEAARQIRDQSALAHIPMIALTALAMPGDRERCLAAGMNEYLTKPVRLRHLVNRIAQLLEH